MNALPDFLNCQAEELPLCQPDACCCGHPASDRRRPYGRGERIFSAGSAPAGIYQVVSGLVALHSRETRNGASIVRLVWPKQAFGHRSTLAEAPHATTAIAATPSLVRFIPKDVFMQHLAENPTRRSQALAYMARQLAGAFSAQSETLVLPAADRLLRLLSRIGQSADGQVRGDWVEFTLPLSYQNIALFLGVAPETLSRMLVKMELDGGIRRNGRSIAVPIALFADHPVS